MSEKYVNDDDVNFRGTIWPAYSLLIDSISFDDEIWHQGDHYYPMTATVIGAPHYLYFFEFEELDFTGIFPDLS